jgi:hypothetical protein
MAVEPEVSAGLPPMAVVSAPGFHGPTTAGTHGIGVSTPRAALVAAATVGLARLEHMPKLGTFTIGAMSVMVAAGRPSIVTREVGRTLSVAGATPKLHCMTAPVTAFWPISGSFIASLLH